MSPTLTPDEIRAAPAKGTVVLTVALWQCLEDEALKINRPPSFIIREILGKHFGLLPVIYQPARQKRRYKEE